MNCEPASEAAAKSLIMAIDYFDLVSQSDELFGENAIDRLLGEYVERGFTGVQWRVSVHGRLAYHTKLGDRVDAEPKGFRDVPNYKKRTGPNFAKLEAILQNIDPLETAVRLAHKHGLTIHPWLTIYDDAGFHSHTESRIVREHPEYSWLSHDGKQRYHGTTSYVYPEVAEYRLAQISELLGYGGDGVYLCVRSHSRPPGWTEEFMRFLKEHSYEEWSDTPTRKNLGKLEEACRGQFGFDPPAVAAFQEQTGRPPHPEDASWWKFRGGYLVEFLKRAKSLAIEHRQRLAFGPHGSFGIYPDGFFDWNRILQEKIVDEIQFGATDDFCGTVEAERRHPWLFSTPGRKNYFQCVKDSRSADEHIQAFEKTGNAQFLDRLDGLTIFEAYMFPRRPELWRFVEHLRTVAG